MVLIRAVGAAEYGGGTQEFCDRYALRFKAMTEIRKLRRQLTNEVNVVKQIFHNTKGFFYLKNIHPFFSLDHA